MRERKRERNISRDVFTAYRRNNRARNNLRCNVTTCVGTCARFTKVAQYSSIRSPLLWAPRSPARALARAHVRRGHPRRARSLPFPNLANLPPRVSSFSATQSLVPSFQHDSNKSTGFYSCLSDILYSAGPGGPHRARVHPPLSLSRPLPRLRTRTPYIINAGKRCICAKYKERRPTSEAPMFGALLIGQFTRCTFSYSTRSHGDIFTDRHKTFSFPLSGITYSMLAD